MRATVKLARLCATLVLLSVPTVAQDSALSLRVDVTEVPVDVTVLDAREQPVTTLKRSDFHVYEDGIEREIRSFMPVETPGSVLFLVHNGFRDAVLDALRLATQTGLGRETIRPDRIWNPLATFLQDAIARFLNRLNAQDRTAIAEFDFGVQKLMDWRSARMGASFVVSMTTGRPSPRAVVQGDILRIGFGHDLYGALTWACEEFEGVQGRKSIVVFDDGRDVRLDALIFDTDDYQGTLDPLFGLPDTEEEAAFRAVVDRVEKCGARIYFVAYGTDRNPNLVPAYGMARILREGYRNPQAADGYLARVRARIEGITSASGGQMLFPKKTADVSPMVEQVAREIGISYRLTYLPADTRKDGVYHRIEVRLADPSLRATQSRSGYVVNPDK